MAYQFEHIHLKAPDPEKTANWYVKAFNFEIFNDRGVRPTGDRFIECKSEDGTIFRISGARTDEAMGQGDADVHYGLEHFGITVDDMDAELERLQALGAELAFIGFPAYSLAWMPVASATSDIPRRFIRIFTSVMSRARPASSFMASRCFGEAPVTVRYGEL